jgi:acrylyl-CoA reductase (NADPH)
MIETRFKALWVERTPEGGVSRAVKEIGLDDLPAGDVLVRVAYSSLNYKDALSASGRYGVTRRYPHIPGIDAAGVVVESRSAEFKPGDGVILGVGEFGANHFGGFAGYARVPAEWVTPLPAGLSLREAAIYGVAGFTAALCVERLIAHGLRPDDGEVLVTGASGGVGLFAVAFLSRSGYRVAAATGKQEAAELLTDLGAARVIPRTEVDDASGKGLLSARWAGGVDTLGGNYLATMLKSIQYGGAVAACGNAASPHLEVSVYPFILRGVTLYGVDTAQVPGEQRRAVWSRLAGEWKLAGMERLAREVSLEELEEEIERSLAGSRVGRVVVKPWP